MYLKNLLINKIRIGIFVVIFLTLVSCEKVTDPIAAYTPYMVFWSDKFNSYGDIVSTNIDGSVQKRLTNSPARDLSPQVSPNGDKIVFHSDRDGNFKIFIMNINGNNLQKLTSKNWSSYPVFSPDGAKIVYQHGKYKKYLYLMNIDGSEKKRLTDGSVHPFEPVFSPDGMHIAFRGDNLDKFSSHIYIMNRDGTGVIKLTDSPNDENYSPMFSPDGSKIVFRSVRGGNWDIYMMNVDGSDQTNLTKDASIESEPIFTPNGKQIIFRSQIDSSGTEFGLFIIDENGENRKMLVEGISGIGGHTISRDGQKIAFLLNYDIYVIDISGNNCRNLTNSSAFEEAPQFVN